MMKHLFRPTDPSERKSTEHDKSYKDPEFVQLPESEDSDAEKDFN